MPPNFGLPFTAISPFQEKKKNNKNKFGAFVTKIYVIQLSYLNLSFYFERIHHPQLCMISSKCLLSILKGIISTMPALVILGSGQTKSYIVKQGL